MDGYLLHWGTAPGTGFTLDKDAGRGVPSPFVAVADGLLDDDDGVPQPTPDLPDIHRFPAQAVRHVDVPGHGGHWCLSVQTRGGPAGRSGVCQFLFADERQDPGALWSWAAGWVASAGRLPAHPSDLPPSAAPPARVESVEAALWGLYAGRTTVCLDGGVDGTSAAIGALVGMLPRPVVMGRVWATYLLRVPVGRDRGFVVGRWPEGVRRDGLPAEVDAWLSAAAGPPPERIDGPRTAEALAVVAARAVGGNPVDLRDCADMAEFVHAATRMLGVRVADVPALVDRADPGLRDHQDVVEQWAWADPDAVIARLEQWPSTRWLREALFAALLAAHRRDPGRDVLRVADPTAPTGWLATLGELFRAVFTEAELIKVLRADFTAPGAPLHDRGRRIDRRDWFEGMGLRNRGGGLDDLFPVALADALAEITAHHRVRDIGRRYLAESENIAAAVGALLSGLAEPAQPELARDLVLIAETPLAASAVLRQVADHNGRFPGSEEAWFTEVAGLVGDRRLTVFELGFSRFGHDASADFLVAAARAYLESAMADNATWSAVLARTADLAATAARLSADLDAAAAERERYAADLRSAHADQLDLRHAARTATAERDRLRVDLATAEADRDRLRASVESAVNQEIAVGNRVADLEAALAEAVEREKDAAWDRDQALGRLAEAVRGESVDEPEERPHRRSVDSGRRALTKRNLVVVGGGLIVVVVLVLVTIMAINYLGFRK